MRNTTTPKTTIRPFATKPNVAITAPCSVSDLVDKLGISINLRAGAVSYQKQSALSAAVSILAGARKPRESAEVFAARAQEALNSLVAA